MKSYLSASTALLCVLLTIGGCLISSDDSPDFFNSIWILEHVDGFSPLHDSVNVYIVFVKVDGRSGGHGRAICNTYGFEGQIFPNHKVRFGQHFQTEVGCGIWNDLEDVYFGQLENSYRFKLDDGRLQFYNALGQEVIRYRAGTAADTVMRPWW